MATKKQQKKIEKVFDEFKRRKLKIGKSNKPVKSRKQALAIALSEAGLARKRRRKA